MIDEDTQKELVDFADGIRNTYPDETECSIQISDSDLAIVIQVDIDEDSQQFQTEFDAEDFSDDITMSLVEQWTVEIVKLLEARRFTVTRAKEEE